MSTALGMIETNGWVALIQAADAMVKTADVRLLGWQKVGGGLVTVLVIGEVAAVQAAVDSGREAGNDVGEVCASHVVPRIHEELLPLIPLRPLIHSLPD
ncbi:MAG: BMC domain-containing protein [Candidatus Latescibacterota bacterium]|nr:BMC domain-containing protein [Candidatus Latescibacterota bacterium]